MTDPAEIASLYTRTAPEYGQVGPPLFAHAGRRLVELTGVAPDQRVLDVATGRGAVLFPAAEQVGPNGYVLGVDSASGMIDETAREIAARGLLHAEVKLMDAQSLSVPSHSFDVLTCSFAVFFFSKLQRTLQGFHRALKPGGQIGFAFTRGTDPRWQWLEQRLGTYVTFPPPTGQPGIRNAGALGAELGAEGFRDVRELVEETELAFGSVDEAWQSLWTHGSRRALELLTEDDLHRFKQEFLATAAKQLTGGGLPITYRYVYVLAAA